MLPTTCKRLGPRPLCSKLACCTAAGRARASPVPLPRAMPGNPVDSNLLAGRLTCVLCKCRFGRNPIVPTMVRTWQERLLQCVKLPTHVVAPADKPNIAIVNRPYDAGRGFLNLDEVAAHIEVSAAACTPPPAAGRHLICAPACWRSALQLGAVAAAAAQSRTCLAVPAGCSMLFCTSEGAAWQVGQAVLNASPGWLSAAACATC